MTNNNQHIPSGYKPTSLGIIPEDWEVKRLGDLCNDISSGRNKIRTELGKYPVYGSTGIIGMTDKYQYEGDKILVARVGAHAGLVSKASGKYDVSDNTIIVENKQNYSIDFAYNQLVFMNLNKLVFGSGQPLITSGMLKRLYVLYPKKEEQARICDLLSLWDTAIAKQTALIEQLTLRKRGLMQQLLTGKKRLKGFEGGAFHRLGNYISECNRRNNGCNRVLSVTNTRGFILQEEQFDKIVASNDTSNYKVVRRGEFAYNPSRVNVGSLAMLNEYDEGILSPMYIVFKANENIDKSYLLQCLQSWWFRGHIPAYTQGSVRDSLSFDGLCSMKFYIPTLQEQKAISCILGQADKEIEIAKGKLLHLQNQKRGLMQILLTGKKRIV
jgi:type I restriction enzyme S subunit